jgi:hypothetical protein
MMARHGSASVSVKSVAGGEYLRIKVTNACRYPESKICGNRGAPMPRFRCALARYGGVVLVVGYPDYSPPYIVKYIENGSHTTASIDIAIHAGNQPRGRASACRATPSLASAGGMDGMGVCVVIVLCIELIMKLKIKAR